MANKLYDETSIQAIADAIRSKNGSSDTYTVSEMAGAIEDIPSESLYCDLPHGISPKDAITWTIPTGTPIKDIVLWGEPGNNNSGWIWAITEDTTLSYNTSTGVTSVVTAYSGWAQGMLNKTVANCRNNPFTITTLTGPQACNYSSNTGTKKPIFNTLDIYDQNGDVLYPANCTLADFGVGEKEYVRVPYIKTTGCQFAIPCYANEDLIFEIKMRRNINGGDLVASAHGWDEYLCEAYDDGYTLYTAGNGVHAYGAKQNTGEWDTVILNKNDGKITVNGATTTQATVSAIGSSKQLYMFGVGNAHYLCADIQYVKVYKDDVLFLDLVPAQTSGGVGCFKDTLSGTEYVSSTTAPLIYVEGDLAPNTTPCIMATGAQYVNTGLAGNRNLTFKFKMKVLVNTALPFAMLAGNWDVNAYLFQVVGAYPDKFNITYFVGQNSYLSVQNVSHDEWHDIEVGPGYITVDGQTTTGTAGTHNNTEIKIFGLKTNYSDLATACVGTIEVYEDNTLIRKYVPMKDPSTTSGYFYDEVNGVNYFSNSNVPLIYLEM